MKQATSHARTRDGHKLHTNAPTDTVQQQKDNAEKRKHSATENALDSTQEKNPVPAGTRR